MSKDEFLKIKTCVLKVHLHCDGCKNKVKKILQKIDGVYTFNIDPELGKVTVSGDLDPATLIKKLAKYGKHVEIWPEVPNSGNPDQIKNMHRDKDKAGKKGANPNINNANQRKPGQKQVKGTNPSQKPEKGDLSSDIDDDGDNDNDNDENDAIDDEIDNGQTEKLPLMGNNEKKGGGIGKNGGKKGGVGNQNQGGGSGGTKNEGKKGVGGNQNQGGVGGGGGGTRNEGKKGGGGNQNQGVGGGGGGGKNGEKNIDGGEDGKKGGSNGKTGDKKRNGTSTDDPINTATDMLYFPGGFGADDAAATNPNYYHQQRAGTNEVFQPTMMYAQPRPSVNYMPQPYPYYPHPYPYPFTQHPQPRSDPYMHAFSDENQSSTCCLM